MTLRKKTWARSMLSFLFASACLLTLMAGCAGGGSSGDSGDSGGSNNTGTVVGQEAGGAATPSQPQQQAPAESLYGDTGGAVLPIVNEPVTITWFVASDFQDVNDRWLVKELAKRTGITVEFQAHSFSTYQDKLKIMLASGQIPDIVPSLTLSEINDLGSQGLFAPINPHIDQLPNFQKLYVEQNSWVMKSFSDDTGNLYSWPIYGLNRDVNHGFMYRKDIFDKHGIPLWETTEQFYEALRQLKEHYPDSTPYASKTKEAIFNNWAFGWGISSDYWQTYPAYYDENDGAWKLTFTRPEYKDMLDFMKKLYDEKLLDQEFLTDTFESWQAKMTTNDNAFVTFDWIGRLDGFYTQVKEQLPAYDLRYANPIGPQGQITSLPKITSGYAVANNDRKETAFRLLDYLSSPSGAELMTMGAEGATYAVDADGNIVYPEVTEDGPVTINLLEKYFGLWMQGSYVRTDLRSVYYNFTEKEQEAQDMMQGKMAPLDPILKFTDEETETIVELSVALKKAGEEFSAKYIMTNGYGDKEWQEWLDRASRLEEERYLNAYNTAQQRFDSQ